MSLAILTEGQLMARQTPKAKPAKSGSTNRQKLASFTDLSPGDLVVHEQYGIGRFEAMEQIRVDGVIKDYVKIAYQGSDTLYVPATQLDLISKYIGGGEDAPVKLNKIGSDAWQKTKTRPARRLRIWPGELIKLYAARKGSERLRLFRRLPWQQEFEDHFPYPETDDQLRCIEEIKGDMESPVPMDRLLCGDVGFGKTEVALRAVMKAVLDSKQVAILVPTTVLAQQHYQTVVSRFRGFPVNVDVLSRFRTAAQQKKDAPGPAGRDPGRDHRDPQALAEERPVQGPGAFGGGRGAALWRVPQGAAEGDFQGSGCTDSVGHPHSQDPQHGLVRDSGHVHH